MWNVEDSFIVLKRCLLHLFTEKEFQKAIPKGCKGARTVKDNNNTR